MDKFLTGVERVLLRSEIISSRTDDRGLITFVNPAFLKVTGYEKNEVVSFPHNIIRHPDVPRSVYRLMWDSIKDGRQFFAVTKNRCKNGDFYWTLGYFQPELSSDGQTITGFRSTRQGVHDESIKSAFSSLYGAVVQAERKLPRGEEQILAGIDLMERQLKRMGFSDYQDFARSAF
ncbi:MAG: hypothetical protein B7X43_00985 [Thiomonas sp. 15-63-373]|nr:MAG: hypothetical protein B7X43_00985 [Thiomonas sp. 15-63-373]